MPFRWCEMKMSEYTISISLDTMLSLIEIIKRQENTIAMLAEKANKPNMACYICGEKPRMNEHDFIGWGKMSKDGISYFLCPVCNEEN